ncbi:hypothetical protein LEP1GSC073_4211 [Leptospira noguchii str. Cascata]|nr:hypothetical protein LEP1GSC072_0094 [Leptospira noguchii str. Bonito]EMS88375.1 hypothetical protein LEP1GSC073_4211 [Leptospira noguchii str. Cascata]
MIFLLFASYVSLYENSFFTNSCIIAFCAAVSSFFGLIIFTFFDVFSILLKPESPHL